MADDDNVNKKRGPVNKKFSDWKDFEAPASTQGRLESLGYSDQEVNKFRSFLGKGLQSEDIGGGSIIGSRWRTIYDRTVSELLQQHNTYLAQQRQAQDAASNERKALQDDAEKTFRESRKAAIDRSKKSLVDAMITEGSYSHISQRVTHMAQGDIAYSQIFKQRNLPGQEDPAFAGTDARTRLLLQSESYLERKRTESKLAAENAYKKAQEATAGDIGTLATNEFINKGVFFENEASVFERALKEKKLAGLSTTQISKRSQKILEKFQQKDDFADLLKKAETVDPVALQEEITKKRAALTSVTEDALSAEGNIAQLKQKKSQETGYAAYDTASAISELETKLTTLNATANKLNNELEESAKLLAEKSRLDRQEQENFNRMASATAFAARGVIQGAELYNEFAGGRSDVRLARAKAGIASIANSQYFNAENAVMNGDVGSLISVIDSNIAAKIANEQASDEVNMPQALARGVIGGAGGALAGRLAGRAIGGFLGGAAGSLLGPGGTVAGALLGQQIGMYAGGVLGASAAAPDAIDSFRGTTDMRARLEKYQAYKQLADADKAIVVSQMQKYYSFNMANQRSAIGSGVSGELAAKELGDMTVLRYYNSQANVTPSMMRDTLHMYQNAGEFSVGPDSFYRRSQLAGGRAQLAGVMTHAEAVSMQTNLNYIGGTDRSFDDLMAFTRVNNMGSRNARDISGVAADISSNVVAQGGAGYDSTLNAAMSSVDLFARFTGNKNLGTIAGVNAIKQSDTMYKDTGYNLANIMELHSIRKTFGDKKLNLDQVLQIQKFGETDLAMIQDAIAGKAGAADKLTNALKTKGLAGIFSDAEGGFDVGKARGFLKEASTSPFNRLIGKSVNGQNMSKAMKSAIETKTPDELLKWVDDPQGGNAILANEEARAAFFSAIRYKQVEQGVTEEQKQQYEKVIKKGKESPLAKQQQAAGEAEASAMEQGSEAAKKYFATHESAMDAISTAMQKITETVISKGGEISSVARSSGEIVASLDNGAKNFEAIMSAVAKQLQEAGVDIEYTPKDD